MSDLATISRLNRFVERAQSMGIKVREELMGGVGAAVCQIKGQQYLFLDLSSGPAEQLEAIRNALAMPED